MIATLTLNPAVDKTMSIPGFAAGKTNRGTVEQVDAGGKGINVAKALAQFGCPVTALGFAGGNNGRLISDALQRAGIAADFVWVPGETRVNLKIKDPDAASETEVNETGPPIGVEFLEALERKVEAASGQCEILIFSGSLPPGVPADIYARFIRIAVRLGARTILDTAGAALRHGVAAGPDLVKPNRAEAEELLGTTLRDIDGAVRAAGRLLGLGPAAVVISLGGDGALAASPHEAWLARCPVVAPRSSIGAGDAMVAALAFAMERRLSLPEALRLAVAAGAASVETNGSASELARLEHLSSQVSVEDVGTVKEPCR